MESEDIPRLENNDDNAEAIKDLQPEDNESDTSDDDYSDEDEEMNCDDEPTNCLFCKTTLTSIELAINHIQEEHKVDFRDLKAKFQMDQYLFIKLINYIRCNGLEPEELLKAKKVFWNDEKYLKPKEYEPWLCYDYDELPAKNTRKVNTKITNGDQMNMEVLKSRVKNLKQQVEEQTLLLEQANEDMIKMRESFQRLIAKENITIDTQNEKELNCVSAKSLESDESYFSSYAHFGIHHEMLSDVVRTTSYRDALLKNKEFISGKDVLDVGCGTSVLSIFASQAGAKTVIGIDNSDIIYNAMDIVKQNNVENVTLVKGRLEDTELPQQKYDIIISEWMGYFLLFEGMLDSIIYARDNHLKPNGILMPNRCTMSLLGYGSDELFDKHITFWNNVYDLDMSNMRSKVLHEPLIEIVDAGHILTDSEIIADLDLAKVDINYSNFTYNFNLHCKKAGKLSAFVGYFDTFFDLPTPIMFGTAPTDEPTHWKQVVFFIEQPRIVKSGDVVSGKLICRRLRGNARSLDIVIEAFGKRCTYYLD